MKIFRQLRLALVIAGATAAGLLTSSLHAATPEEQAVLAPGTTQIEERIHDPLVRIDNDLAVVWAPFEFLMDGKVDHCGTDLFNLVRKDGKWLIASVADTGRKDCVAK
jgi:hypothetical protein